MAPTEVDGRSNALLLLRLLALTLLASTYTTMVLGAYVKAIGAGMACPDWPTCRGGSVTGPLGDPAVAAEFAHRTAALLVALTGLVLLVVELLRFRAQRGLLLLTVAAAGTLAVQIALGALTISTVLEPVVVTAHLAVATLFFGLALLIAGKSFRTPDPRSVPSPTAGTRAAPLDNEPQSSA